MKTVFVKQLRAEDELLDEPFLLLDFTQRKTKDGRPYILFNLGDKSGRVGGVFWNVPDRVVEASPVQLRREAAEILRVVSTSNPSQELTDVETRVLEDIDLFLDESRLEDSAVLLRHVDVAHRMLKLASQKNIQPEIRDAYLQAFTLIL